MSRSAPVIGLIVAFVVLVGVTVGGVAANSPRHRAIPGSASFRPPKTYGAEVVAVRAIAWARQGPAHHVSLGGQRRHDADRGGR